MNFNFTDILVMKVAVNARNLCLLTITLFLYGCVGIIEEKTSSQCFLLAQNSVIVKSGCPGISIEHMIIADNQSRDNCDGSEVANVPSGTQIEVLKIMKFAFGSYGQCFRAIAKTTDRELPEVEVPFCPYIHPDSWFEDSSSGIPDQLIPKSKFLKPCR